MIRVLIACAESFFLLDIGLPTMNGIEAARRILKLAFPLNVLRVVSP